MRIKINNFHLKIHKISEQDYSVNPDLFSPYKRNLFIKKKNQYIISEKFTKNTNKTEQLLPRRYKRMILILISVDVLKYIDLLVNKKEKCHPQNQFILLCKTEEGL